MPKQSPSIQSLRQSSIRFPPEDEQLLQNEAHRVNTVSIPQLLIEDTNSRPSALNSMNTPRQLVTNNSIIPSIQYVINIDPLQQMKEFVKSFSGNSEDDASKWLASINHFFDIIRLPGDKDEMCLQYAPAFLKTNAYRW